MLKSIARRILYLCQQFGVDPQAALKSVCGLPYYFRDAIDLKRQQKISSVPFPFATPHPCLSDRFSEAGVASGHYFHQDLLVAQKIFQHAPIKHVDVGSRVDGFVAHVAVYREIEVFDVRPVSSRAINMNFRQVDMMGSLSDSLKNYCDSVSCLHALEHFGLGRYGDPVNFEGHLKGIRNLMDLLVPSGKLYLSVPIGPQRIEFNAHRVFSVPYLLSLISGFKVDSFSYVDDQGALHQDVPLESDRIKTNYGCWYGCGILELTKI
jgi:hypothetical protein